MLVREGQVWVGEENNLPKQFIIFLELRRNYLSVRTINGTTCLMEVFKKLSGIV